MEIFDMVMSRDLPLDALNINGETPLLIAIKRKNQYLVEQLLRKGAMVNKPDPTPYGLDEIYYAHSVAPPLVEALNLTGFELRLMEMIAQKANPHGTCFNESDDLLAMDR